MLARDFLSFSFQHQLLIVQHLSICEAAERAKDLANELKQSMQETMVSCQERLAYVETDLQQSKEQLSTLREMMVTWHNLVAGFFRLPDCLRCIPLNTLASRLPTLSS